MSSRPPRRRPTCLKTTWACHCRPKQCGFAGANSRQAAAWRAERIPMQVEVSKLIDAGRWSIYQKFLIACTALTIILDGVDNQILALTMKSISKDWSLTPG